MGIIKFVFLFLMVLSACTHQPDKLNHSGDDEPPKQINSQQNNTVGYKENPPGTFLLVGIDSRGEDQSRADTILVAQYEHKHNQLKLASIMRDCYVKIPGYPQHYHKINAAYYFGGTELLKETILVNFNLQIDHVVTIDFQGFKNLVDLLVPDGVEVQVSETMIDDMSMEASAGLNRLHGEEILKYVRYRHDDNSDFGRVQRQQEVLLKLKNEIANRLGSVEGITVLPGIIKEGLGMIETDMQLNAILGIGSQLILNNAASAENLTIPLKGTFQDKLYPHAGAVLEINIPENQEALSEFFSSRSGQNNKEI
ncbi:LytR family transcriptional regulator [Peribacillus saganii]|uniref:Regulatory protein MsrR n=1 Tax=Peribacillus saganii TaxID=2303992 RepID=A0A372LJ62_9BACI|nr:LCP family protein [Peribacillus saganii]RFU66435.1 LytR family transcriptional regulator [Peribacillus saganii]